MSTGKRRHISTDYRRGKNPGSRKKFGSLSSRHARNRTGVVGIGFTIMRRPLGGRLIDWHFYSARGKRPDGEHTCRHYCIEKLGNLEAWRRALKFRAGYEQQVATMKGAQ